MNNPSGINPTEYRVVVQPIDAEEIALKGFSALKQAGFKMDDTSKDRHQYAAQEAVLVACSPLAFTYAEWPEGSRVPAPGDRVLIEKYAGVNHTGKDGVMYRVLNDKDLVAVLD